jgi:hypothetical protein
VALERHEALSRLQERYGEARDHGSLAEAHANLEWILGARRSAEQWPEGFDRKLIPIVALWLEDLANELDRQAPPAAPYGDGEAALREDRTRQAVAAKLRAAAEGFLAAFRLPASNP